MLKEGSERNKQNLKKHHIPEVKGGGSSKKGILGSVKKLCWPAVLSERRFWDTWVLYFGKLPKKEGNQYQVNDLADPHWTRGAGPLWTFSGVVKNKCLNWDGKRRHFSISSSPPWLKVYPTGWEVPCTSRFVLGESKKVPLGELEKPRAKNERFNVSVR